MERKEQMKHIIYIPKELYKNIVEDNCSMREMQILLRVIKDGTPLEEELEKIKAEIDESSFETYEKYSEEPIFCNYTLNIMQIIDNHIEELKGENKCSL